MKVDTAYNIMGCTFLASIIATLGVVAYRQLTMEQPVKEEPVKPESVTERIFREYDIDSSSLLNREELSNFLKDYRPQHRGE